MFVPEARRLAEKLDESSHSKEAVLLTSRIRLCELASNLYERASTMPLDEMRRSIEPLQQEGVVFPTSLQLRVVSRHCLHLASEQDHEGFFEVWCPWSLLSDLEEFDPCNPSTKSLVATLLDKEMQLNSLLEDDEDTKDEDKKKLDEKNTTLSSDWQAGKATVDRFKVACRTCLLVFIEW
eukprot:Skav218632  [mRNA]  locus=scaffold365:183292:183831:+ [translate_table: standard]